MNSATLFSIFKSNFFFVSFKTIFTAIKNKYINLTCYEFLILFIYVAFAMLIFKPFIFKYIIYFVFIIFFSHPFFIIYIYKRKEQIIITIINNFNFQNILYSIVYRKILPFSIGILCIYIKYIFSDYDVLAEWEVWYMNGLILMIPFPGGSSMYGGGGSMGGNQGSPSPQPPRGPSPSGNTLTYDRPTTNEKKQGCVGSYRPISDSVVYEDIKRFRRDNPKCIVPIGASLLFDDSIDRNIQIGTWRTNSRGIPKAYYMHCYHNNPIEVSHNNETIIMPASPRPEGFFTCSYGIFRPVDWSKGEVIRKDIYVKDIDGNYVLFPKRVPRGIRNIWDI